MVRGRDRFPLVGLQGDLLGQHDVALGGGADRDEAVFDGDLAVRPELMHVEGIVGVGDAVAEAALPDDDESTVALKLRTLPRG